MEPTIGREPLPALTGPLETIMGDTHEYMEIYICICISLCISIHGDVNECSFSVPQTLRWALVTR